VVQRVFLDASGILALANRDDAPHVRSVDVYAELSAGACPLTTSDWVLTECLGRASRGPLRPAICRIVRRLQLSTRAQIVPATHQDWQRACDLLQARPDKEWFLVDCVSLLTCEDQGIHRVFSHDHHFVQAGLEVLWSFFCDEWGVRVPKLDARAFVS
jgi:predicted nucleic acid-binding protein